MNLTLRALLLTAVIAGATTTTQAEDLSAAAQSKVTTLIKEIQGWAANPAIVSAVKAQNASAPADYAAMTQEKWKSMTVLDPFVRSFGKNAAAEALKKAKTDLVSEAFLSDANGLKVAFLNKTSNWSHKGKPKHDVPMTGKTWQGPVEMDESTGLQLVQVSVPVLDGEKPIGSLVVGLSVAKLSQ